ncbi:MAG: lytic transglycosylase domain-containing protein [bacterium]
MDYMNSSTPPTQWGITRMMERIKQIQERFNAMLPMPRINNDFQSQLKDSLQQNNTAPEELLMNPSKTTPITDELLRTDNTIKYEPGNLDELIKSTADRYNLDTKLLHAVVKAESNYNPNAVSPKGAMGLMQLMPATAESLGVQNPFSPAENIDGGARFLKSLIDKYGGDLQLALAAYNAGPAAVDAHSGIPPYDETRTYITRVLDILKKQ